MGKRIDFDEIDSSGTFRSGDIRLDVRFRDAEGNVYTWYPEWDDVRNLYAEAEKVEELNMGDSRELEELKELKHLDDPIIDEIARVLANTWTGDDLGNFFRDLGYEVDYGYQVEENASTFPAETGGPERVRKDFVRSQLRELNDGDYKRVIEVVEEAANPKRHINLEERHSALVKQLNMALEHEGLQVTMDGNVLPVQYENESDES